MFYSVPQAKKIRYVKRNLKCLQGCFINTLVILSVCASLVPILTKLALFCLCPPPPKWKYVPPPFMNWAKNKLDANGLSWPCSSSPKRRLLNLSNLIFHFILLFRFGMKFYLRLPLSNKISLSAPMAPLADVVSRDTCWFTSATHACKPTLFAAISAAYMHSLHAHAISWCICILCGTVRYIAIVHVGEFLRKAIIIIRGGALWVLHHFSVWLVFEIITLIHRRHVEKGWTRYGLQYCAKQFRYDWIWKLWSWMIMINWYDYDYELWSFIFIA